MSNPRLFLPPHFFRETVLTLPEEESHYLKNVLRMKKGDSLLLLDGKGNFYRARVESMGKRGVTVRIEEKGKGEDPSFPFILAQAILKGEKMDFIIQKAVELGVKELIPITTRRTVVKGTRKIHRWREIARSSAQQCGRYYLPIIYEETPWEDFLNNYSSGWILYEKGGKPLPQILQEWQGEKKVIVIGPEGGFEEEEVEEAMERGFEPVSLGKLILRAETATFYTLSVLKFFLEFKFNFNSPR